MAYFLGPCRTTSKAFESEKKPEGYAPFRLRRWSRQQESNLHLALRRHSFYPLNYGEGTRDCRAGFGWRGAVAQADFGEADSDSALGHAAQAVLPPCRSFSLPPKKQTGILAQGGPPARQGDSAEMGRLVRVCPRNHRNHPSNNTHATIP